jgi:hypothetical protein
MDIYTVKTIRAHLGELVNRRNLVIVVVIVLIFAWIPDGIYLIFKHFLRNDLFIGMLMLIFSIAILIFLYLFAKRELRKRVKYRVEETAKRDFKILVLFLSREKDPERYEEIKSLEDLRRVSEDKNQHLRWEMPIIAINEYKKSLKKIVVIPSQQSYEQFSHFKDLVVRIFGDGVVVDVKREVDFEKIEDIQEVIEEIYESFKREGFKNADIVIDITGGQKPVSIAGAAATIIYPDRYFQYVSTVTKEVKVFNMNSVEV